MSFGYTGVPRSDHLFVEYDLHALLESQGEQTKAAISKLTKGELISTTDDALVDRFVEQFKVVTPVIDHGTISVDQEDAKIDISQDSNRLVFDRSRPYYIQGTKVTVYVPFTGDAILFRSRPSTYNLNPPRGHIHDEELQLTYMLPEVDPAQLKNEIDSELAKITQGLGWVESDAKQFNDGLPALIRGLVENRRSKVDATGTAIASLGFKVRPKEAATPSPMPVSEAPKAAKAKAAAVTGADFFISHASEDKSEVAKPLADALTALGYQVWLDQAELKVGDSLRTKIDEGLRGCKFGIVVLSHNFFAKNWPQYELNGLVTRQMVGGLKVILPVWHGVNQQDVASYSPSLADLMATNTSRGIDTVVKDLSSAYGGQPSAD